MIQSGSQKLVSIQNDKNMTRFTDLNAQDRKQLLRYPAYLSLLASTATEGFDQKEMQAAVKLTHIKTFGGDPLVMDFYREAEKYFSAIIFELNEELPKDRIQRAAVITKELEKLQNIIEKLGSDYAAALLHSMRIYKDQVSKAHHNVLEYFIFPMPIKGLSN